MAIVRVCGSKREKTKIDRHLQLEEEQSEREREEIEIVMKIAKTKEKFVEQWMKKKTSNRIENK